VLDWLEQRTGDGGHVAAGAFTAADLFFAPMVDYHRTKTGDDATFGARPSLARWFKETSGRPSFPATGAA
jgi:glutathione S-transferase